MTHTKKLLVLCTISMSLIAPPKTRSKDRIVDSEKTPKSFLILLEAAQYVLKGGKLPNTRNPSGDFKSLISQPLPKENGLKKYPQETVDYEYQKAQQEVLLRKCLLCSIETRTHKTLLQHILAHHELKNRPFKCPHCNTGFVRITRLNAHISKKHSNQEKQ